MISTPTPAPTAASFLNLDLEIEAANNLDPLARHFDGRAFVLFSRPTETGFRLSLEPLIEGRLNADPVACTEHFLLALESLPASLMNLWHACRSRVFDFGFDGGLESPPIHMDLPAPLLDRIARLNLSLRMTIYPFHK